MAVNISGLRRNIKNVAHNYTDAQVKVREATSNDPWGPSSTMMSEIADMTYNTIAFADVMQMIWKRLNDQGKNWRHVYKALVLLEYLMKTGSEKVAQQCKENIFALQALRDFQYYEENKDWGINVREKAKTLVSLLKDDERLKNERVRALKARERFIHSTPASSDANRPFRPNFQDGSGAFIGGSSVFSGSAHPTNPEFATPGTGESPSDIELARPQTAGEEELQLQLALAMSREQADSDDKIQMSDQMRLDIAIKKSASQNPNEIGKSSISSSESGGVTRQSSSAFVKASDDLLDLDFGNPISMQQAPVFSTIHDVSTSKDPFSPIVEDKAMFNSDNLYSNVLPTPPVRTTASMSSTSDVDPWNVPVKAMQASQVNNTSHVAGNVEVPWTPPNDPWEPVQISKNHDNATKTNESNNMFSCDDPFSSPSSNNLVVAGVKLNGSSGYGSAATNDPWSSSVNPDGSDSHKKSFEMNNADLVFSDESQADLQKFDRLRSQIEGEKDDNEISSNLDKTPVVDPFNLAGMDKPSKANNNNNNKVIGGVKSKPKPQNSVQSMLTQHSKLVDLDNLLINNNNSSPSVNSQSVGGGVIRGGGFSVTDGKPPISNPFASSSPHNPFESPSSTAFNHGGKQPALNQLMQSANKTPFSSKVNTATGLMNSSTTPVSHEFNGLNNKPDQLELGQSKKVDHITSQFDPFSS